MALPNCPSRTFSYVYDVFACSESPKSTFGALGLFGAVRIAMGVRHHDGRTDGTLRPGTGWLRGGAPAKSYHVCGSASIPPPLQHFTTKPTPWGGGGVPHLSLSDSPSVSKNSTTANLTVLLWCQYYGARNSARPIFLAYTVI